MRMSTACDLIIEGNKDEVQCRAARDLRAGAAMSMYDIVTDPDPYIQTINLIVVVSLQTIAWAEEDKAHRVFGDRGSSLVEALHAAHEEVMKIAGNILTKPEIETVDDLIRDWRKKNPELRHLAHARFSDFINSEEWSPDTREKASGLFAEIESARHSVDEALDLAERGMYLTKRMPLILELQSEATVDTLLANPPVARALDDFHSLSETADKMPQTLDAQRKALLADLDQRQPAMDASVKNISVALGQADAVANDAKSLLVELQKASAALESLVKQSDAMIGRFTPAPSATPAVIATASGGTGTSGEAAPPTAAGAAISPAAATSAPQRPFDIRDYTAALKEAGNTATELNTALVSSSKLLDSPDWKLRIDEVNSAADGRMQQAAGHSRALVDLIFQQVYIALGALLVVLVLARLISTALLRRMGHKSHAS
jgi:hypothetical protein